MTQPEDFRMRPRLPLRAWVALILGLTLVAAILIAVAVVAVSVFLFLIPVIAIVAVLYYLFPSMFRRKTRQSTIIIDGEFRVVDPAVDEERGRLPRNKDGA